MIGERGASCQALVGLGCPRKSTVLKTAQTLIGHGGASGVFLLDKYAKPWMLRLRETVAAV